MKTTMQLTWCVSKETGKKFGFSIDYYFIDNSKEKKGFGIHSVRLNQCRIVFELKNHVVVEKCKRYENDDTIGFTCKLKPKFTYD